jgi:hypothetical protein
MRISPSSNRFGSLFQVRIPRRLHPLRLARHLRGVRVLPIMLGCIYPACEHQPCGRLSGEYSPQIDHLVYQQPQDRVTRKSFPDRHRHAADSTAAVSGGGPNSAASLLLSFLPVVGTKVITRRLAVSSLLPEE